MPRELHPIDAHVGKNLRVIRIRRGLSQKKLVEKLDISSQQIHKYESGTNRISASKLYRLAEILEVSVLCFYEGLDKTEINPLPELEPGDYRLMDSIHNIQDKNVRKIIATLIGQLGG